MRFNVLSGYVKSKSHLTVAPSAWRKYCAGYCCHLVGMGVIISVKLVVGHIIDTGYRYSLPRLEFIYIFCHVDLLFSELLGAQSIATSNEQLPTAHRE